ncbi:MAG: hypothetical protein EOP62_03765 [Sphingomonadales bacterium]|nr:MAG: hypothetical protein EOP62_03765 [Sphingomonadales bacterium]
MTRDALIDLFIRKLLREGSGTRRRWRAVLGEVKLYSIATHPHCNWLISPSGDSYENAAVERLADQLRSDHPIVVD